MLTTILMCQQGIPFEVSPARTQMVDELIRRGSKVILFFPGRVKNTKLKRKIDKIVNTGQMSCSAVRKKIYEKKPDIVICFTVEDAEICFPLPYIMKNTDFYYYNLEIYVHSLKSNFGGLFGQIMNKVDYLENKIKEILYVRGCRSIVIQDRLRKKILKKYRISHPTTWLIPNSYNSPDDICEKPRKKELIYSGSVSGDVLGSFIEHADELKDIAITVSGWDHVNPKLKKNPNITVMTQNLSQEAYTRFINTYDIALIWYSDQKDDNVYNIGLASGKFFKHLSLGQPVIVNNVPGLATEVRKNKLGAVVDDLSQLADAVQTIRANYDMYVERIKQIYESKYDYKKVSCQFFDHIIERAERKR